MAAHLDPTFGSAGRTELPAQLEGAQTAVLMRDNSLVLGTGRALIRLTPRGQPDEAFGEGGTVTLQTPPDRSFTMTGLAVDSHDRLVVAGTVVGPAEEVRFVGPSWNGAREMAKTARVLRYLPNGLLDPTFGNDGVVETDLDLPAPRNAAGEPLLSRSWVAVTGVAVDSKDRVILTGAASAGAEILCTHDWFFPTLTYAAFVARLTQAGTLDPSFGATGVFGGHSTSENPLHAEVSASPLIQPGDKVLYSADSGNCHYPRRPAGLAELGVNGEERASFGAGGTTKQAFFAAAVGDAGSITTLGDIGAWPFGKKPERTRVTQLWPNGRPQRSYGRQGQVVVVEPGGPRSHLHTLTVDPHGSVLLGGTMVSAKLFPGPTAHAKKRHRRFLLLMRLNRRGSMDRTFGPQGRIATRFGSLAVWESSVLLDSEGRAVVVGSYGRGQGQGFVVARYVIEKRLR